MKKSDIAIIILLVGLVTIATYFLLATLVGEPGDEPVSVETIEPITTEIVQPNPTIFNEDAINPTVKIKIGDSADQQPFTLGE